MGEELLILYPQLGINAARPLTQKRQVALIHLCQHLVRRPIHSDIGIKAMLLSDLLHHILVRYILEGARAPRHAQIVQAVLCQHYQEPTTTRWILSLERADTTFEDLACLV